MELRTIVMVAALAACGGGNSAVEGSLGGHCRSDGTCNAGLACAGAVCIAEGIDAPVAHADGSVDSPATTDATPADAAPTADATSDATPADAATDSMLAVDGSLTDAALDAPAAPILKVKNYLAWCSVIVDGHPASAASEQDVAVTAGTINVSAIALSGFQLGTAPWHDTTGDTGAGDPGTRTGTGQATSSATTVVVGASGKCAWVCCEFTSGGGCPTTDQCP